MNIHQQNALHVFCRYWLQKNQSNEEKTEASETSDTQKFWMELIYDVLGMSKHTFELEFEKSIYINRVGGGIALLAIDPSA